MLTVDVLVERWGGDLVQVAATWNGMNVGESVLDSVDPYFWGSLGVRFLGHKYLFARGIAALQKT